MRGNNGAVIVIGGLFGCIAFATCAFLLPLRLALLFGLFTAGVFIVVLRILLFRNDRKYRNIDEALAEDILLKETANHYEGTPLHGYGGKRVRNGILFLTRSRLVFISREKRQEFRLDIPLGTIAAADWQNRTGLLITTDKGDVSGFVLPEAEAYLVRINSLRNGETQHGDYICAE